MKTEHKIYYSNSNHMSELKDNSVDLIVTSPPYPMIEMWDTLFFNLNPDITNYFNRGEYWDSFSLMHEELKKTWRECYRVTKEGGTICINIGDATRTLNNNFQLWSNHTIINHFFINDLKMNALPIILWRKSTNKPNKFMGSGMLPPNAYVTLEHEYILIFRKGLKREFKNSKVERYESSYFWEERNNWFSDVWFDLVGTNQNTNSHNQEIRKRSAAFPIELAYRLINMFSVYNDTVLDPFWGIGTTSIASMLLMRNSIGYEIDKELGELFDESISNIKFLSNNNNRIRIEKHKEFIQNRTNATKHKNKNYDLDVVTSQEKDIKLYSVDTCNKKDQNKYFVHYKEYSPTVYEQYVLQWQ